MSAVTAGTQRVGFGPPKPNNDSKSESERGAKNTKEEKMEALENPTAVSCYRSVEFIVNIL